MKAPGRKEGYFTRKVDGRWLTRYAPKRKEWIEQSIFALLDDGYFNRWRSSGEVARWLTANMPGKGRWANVTSGSAGQMLRRFVGEEPDTLRLRILPSALQRQYISQEAWEALDEQQRIKIQSETIAADSKCEIQRRAKRQKNAETLEQRRTQRRQR